MTELRRSVIGTACVTLAVIGAFLLCIEGYQQDLAWAVFYGAGMVLCVMVYGMVLPADCRRRCLVVLSAVLLVELGVFGQPWLHQQERRVTKLGACLMNEKQLALGVLYYASDNDDRLPVARNWRTATEAGKDWHAGLEPRCPVCPTAWSYGLNVAVSGGNTQVVPDQVVMIFEANAMVKDFAGRAGAFVPRHEGRGSVGFLDGHCVGMRPAGLDWGSR